MISLTLFFNRKIYSEIDDLSDSLVSGIDTLQNIADKLSTYIEEKKKMKDGKPIIKVDKTKSGYFLSLTKIRADKLQLYLSNKKSIEITNDFTLKVNRLEFKDAIPNKQGKYSNTKIFINSNKINNKIDSVENSDLSIIELKSKLFSLVKEKYLEVLLKCSEKYKTLFPNISQFIAIIDFFKSNAATATLYNYCRPIIIEKQTSSFSVVNLRHPIVERIKTDVEYVPHTLSLGSLSSDGMDGMLLYGVNSSGKSCLMKAIGTLFPLAQNGMYVPAESFEYSPYESIFARITGNDNMFKGLSQFALEMNELQAILKRKNPKTLVIGDEVCRGTEHISGNSIVASTILSLAKSKCSFIFATHLHEIANNSKVKKLSNVKSYHLTVDYDKKRDVLIFDRKLKPGPGSSIYGLTVAKYIIKDDEFLETAQEIMNELLDEKDGILSGKTTKYNNKVFVTRCLICGRMNTTKKYESVLDVHHINHQKNCDINKFVIGKSHLQMNNKCNLAVLCKTCHYKVHHNELEIYGYLDTSNGPVLDYKIL